MVAEEGSQVMQGIGANAIDDMRSNWKVVKGSDISGYTTFFLCVQIEILGGNMETERYLEALKSSIREDGNSDQMKAVGVIENSPVWV